MLEIMLRVILKVDVTLMLDSYFKRCFITSFLFDIIYIGDKMKKFISTILLYGLIFAFFYSLYYTANKDNIVSMLYSDGVLTINFDERFESSELYCLFTTEEEAPSFDADGWIKVKDSKCDLEFGDGEHYNLFIRNDIKVVHNYSSKKGFLYEINLDKDKIYVAVNGKYDITYKYKGIGKFDDVEYSSSDENVFTVSDNKITGVGVGNAKLTVSGDEASDTLDVVVTDLITASYPLNDYDWKKKELGCNTYSKADNDLIDEILKDRINDAGYKTRAGAVEAARFLVLEFPYKLSYFYENGRQTTNNVDGEGRYYHVGLYLHESRFKKITGSSTGPEVWGCPLYCNPGHRYIDNGLDCSGYVSWALLNAGFDVKDVGAGWSNNLDLTDYGDVKSFTTSLINSGKIKVGDLVHSTHSGGHIGMIIGIDDKYFYIAQALWNDAAHSLTKRNPNVMAVQITKYTKKEIKNIFPDVVLMDKYYKKDGNLTVMWD